MHGGVQDVAALLRLVVREQISLVRRRTFLLRTIFWDIFEKRPSSGFFSIPTTLNCVFASF